MNSGSLGRALVPLWNVELEQLAGAFLLIGHKGPSKRHPQSQGPQRGPLRALKGT